MKDVVIPYNLYVQIVNRLTEESVMNHPNDNDIEDVILMLESCDKK